MAIKIKSRQEIEKMRVSGIIVRDALSKIKEMCLPGVTTARLNEIAEQFAAEAGAETLFKGVKSPYAKIPFPGAICSSVNEQVVHGIPSQRVKISEGDIVSVDFGVW